LEDFQVIGVYVRVSTDAQNTASQDRELKQWAKAQTEEIQWYRDKATGTNLNRPQFQKMLDDVRTGLVTKVVVWRLDRLGRTTRGLLELFEELQLRGTGFVSLRESVDLSTPSGRLMLSMLSSVAQYETEVRAERQRAGIEAAKEANGGKCPWGGREKGFTITVTPEKRQLIEQLHANKTPIAKIARLTGCSRQSVYRVLGLWSRSGTVPVA
jgi:DNA invertase Pin-like site-specific DNA recombinase